uniref:Uncharacterized protein n=1 Tax=Siphoviridae sp. ctvph17 TaxID=2825724 RepID=A0A8S5UJP5_9CAUD|nr:MAG TPA: hypothetical protein [Siphoviridae sp. ctvph17]
MLTIGGRPSFLESAHNLFREFQVCVVSQVTAFPVVF